METQNQPEQGATLGLPNVQLLKLNEVLPVVRVSRATWYRGIKDGRFPKPVKLGAQTNLWRSTDIAALLANGAEVA